MPPSVYFTMAWEDPNENQRREIVNAHQAALERHCDCWQKCPAGLESVVSQSTDFCLQES